MIKKKYSLKKISILGGYWKNKKLFIPYKESIRPTIHRIRAILFDWLNPIIYGSNCLDCFAGSGSLGIEAISRSAYNVTFLENDYIAIKHLIKNAKNLNIINQVKVIYINSLIWLSKPSRVKFNVIFIDPPYHKNMVDKTVFLLNKNCYLEKNAYIYISTEVNNIKINIPNNWTLYKKKTTKKNIYRLYVS